MAYRFSNFKNRKVIDNAKKLEMLDNMLKHVKRLIMRRDKIYTVSKKDLLQKVEKKL